jgi:hypothetical protein
MSDTPISPPSGSVAAAGVALAMALSFAIVPLAGGVSVSNGAPVVTQQTSTAIAPTVGAVALAGVAPTFAKPTVTAMVPTVGALALAGVASTVAQASGAVTSFDGLEQGLVTWSGIGNGQLGTGVPFRSGKVSLQVSGTFGSGGSIKLQGSNDLVNWADLTPTALTSAGFFAALGANEKPRAIRPNCTAGDTTTALTVVGWFSS